MNEWDKLHRQAERYKAEYPSGTRIMLLSMGEDMHRVEDNTCGTVLTVDDMYFRGERISESSLLVLSFFFILLL